MSADSVKEDIRLSLQILLSMRKGERVMRPEYGIDFPDLSSAPTLAEAIEQLSCAIDRAILLDEPRIDLLSVDIQCIEDGIFSVSLCYLVRSLDEKDICEIQLSLEQIASSRARPF